MIDKHTSMIGGIVKSPEGLSEIVAMMQEHCQVVLLEKTEARKTYGYDKLEDVPLTREAVERFGYIRKDVGPGTPARWFKSGFLTLIKQPVRKTMLPLERRKEKTDTLQQLQRLQHQSTGTMLSASDYRDAAIPNMHQFWEIILRAILGEAALPTDFPETDVYWLIGNSSEQAKERAYELFVSEYNKRIKEASND